MRVTKAQQAYNQNHHSHQTIQSQSEQKKKY